MLDNIKTHFLVLTLSCLWFWLGFLKYTSALPVGSMYSYRKAGGSVAFSWMSKWGCVWRWDVGDIIDCFWLLLIIPLYFTLKTIYLVLFGDIIFTTQKMTTLHTKHTTLHTNYTLQTRYMSQISQLSKLAISVAVCVTAGVPHTALPILSNQTCCLDTFVTKASFYCFFLHQTQSKHDGNVREKVWRTLFTYPGAPWHSNSPPIRNTPPLKHRCSDLPLKTLLFQN